MLQQYFVREPKPSELTNIPYKIKWMRDSRPIYFVLPGIGVGEINESTVPNRWA